MEVILGVGKIDVRSWWIHLMDANGALVWEGIVDAMNAPEEANKRGLNILRGFIPQSVLHHLSMMGSWTATWEPAWEQVPLAALPKSEVV